MDHNNQNQLNKCYTLLKNHDTAVIATSSTSAEPHASVVNYFMDKSLDIFFIAREGAQKYKNINSNPLTCLVVFNSNFENSLEVKGSSYQLADSPKATDLLMEYAKIIKRRNSGQLPIMKHPGSELFLFRLAPHVMRYADFKLSANDEGEYFELHLRTD